MSKISLEDVQHIANLARLTFNEQEMESYQHQLSRILDYIEKLNQLDTEGVPPTSHVIPIRNVMKPDEKRDLFQREDITANAPSTEQGYFEVPKVIE
ncbi:MAG: Asp-tRNA(Asn)/Glu-tRNA(Gln) amidotransferase subunit GatC [Candidatus Poribacteria bacterium]|jgi:aspartyl-tRNA(Asn)/glutamyl-tRNA(Gln) amidotransferase subunit C|nr:Asp-tRNA(Asn)/Glu-tRNA(Gln) amidotransferase subunit GatC [Candidatus Poribacteria bacterium]MDP6750903.1 Asp-tRNA(Asn)/Glu-tRNA(Gln) amidotransferase subunit GatC [Candidatus Poribacteria bacterium]MDP6999394.1 Asp-tRNA(Asn)/Glu-tRNA(Gln) amidotransferase subunit GatC [Candidatus Poribacteria bacterium]